MDEDAIFLAAIELTAAEARAAYLDQACAGNPQLRASVEQLLAAHHDAGSFLAGKAPGLNVTIASPPSSPPVAECAGTQIGPYKLLQEIGQGGMGMVYLAEQLEPVRRKVALKIIKPGMDTRQVIARFEAERQALSLMDHPNIARVLDAGATAGGRPFFVMELVKGQPITQYCDEKHLAPRQRLELLLPVCQAIQHAHQKGVIHRDIKPSNILVAEYDQKPVPKVIDFGVAKAISQPLTEKTVFTGYGQIVGTLEYMSPEQAKVNQLDIDTRSDIYSLGVLMYELLTGTTPIDKQRLRSAAWDEMLRIIREEEPPKPSTRLSESKDSLPSVSALRQTEPARLTKLVRGELDWIVMRALEKDRDRRYETANGLAADIQRYLNDEPVVACPPSVAYRLRKFARRHRGPLSIGALLLFLLLTGTLATTVGMMQAVRAERTAVEERKRTEVERDAKEVARREAATSAEQAEAARGRTREALNTLTDEVVEQWMGRQPRLGTTEKAFLLKVQQYYEGFARSQGGSEHARFDRADGLARVGKIQFRLGEIPAAKSSFREAAERFQQLVADSPNPANRLGKANCLANLAMAQMATGGLTESADSFGQALGLLRQLTEEHPDVVLYQEKLANVQNGFATLLMRTGQIQVAESTLIDAIGNFRKLAERIPEKPEYRSLLAGSLNNLALLGNANGSNQVEKLLREVVEIYRQLADEAPEVPTHRNQSGMSLYNLGNYLSGSGRIVEAEAAYREAVNVLRKLVAEYPAVPRYRQDLASGLSNFGNLLRSPQRMEEGERLHRESVAIFQQLINEFGPAPDFRNGLGTSLINLGGFLGSVARPRDAEPFARQAITVLSELVQEFPGVPDYAAQLATALRGLAHLKNDVREFGEARALLEQARPILRQALDAQPADPGLRAANHGLLQQLAKSSMGLRDHAAATVVMEELTLFGFKPVSDTFNAARLFAQCIDQVQEDEQLDEAARRELIDRYSQRAMELLQSTVQAGFTRGELLQNGDFDSIRDRADFQRLVEQLSKRSP